jgi:L-ribulokinase
VDYGTSSVRAVIVDAHTGEEVAQGVWAYPHGEQGVLLDPRDPNLARQHPRDYFDGFVAAVSGAVREARERRGIDPARIVGIGVDTTASTPIPVDAGGVPLAMHEEFARTLDAMAWLWKDHTAHAEAEEITDRVRSMGLPYLAKCGGAYSSEWYWSKMLRCERAAPGVARAVHSWVECCDLVPAWLTGTSAPGAITRGICAAGHKAMYHAAWGGPPAEELLESLAPGFGRFGARYGTRVRSAVHPVGTLTPELAARVGLSPGIAVAGGVIDAHVGAVGAGIGPGTLVKIIGTSTCDCMVMPMNAPLADIPGVCGIVPESILPGMYGIEAGQSAVGDIFDWYVRMVSEMSGEGAADAHQRLTRGAAALRPGASGLLALDWHNGNRNPLTDPRLTGLVVGQSLRTTQAEMYRTLIEATAFGALKIIDRIASYGVPIERVVNCGGIAEKNPLVMQIYADVCDRPMHVSGSAQTCALGAAIFGSVVGGAHASVQDAQKAMTRPSARVHAPDPAAARIYRELYILYGTLHDAFGTRGAPGDVFGVMKKLLDIRGRARA